VYKSGFGFSKLDLFDKKEDSTLDDLEKAVIAEDVPNTSNALNVSNMVVPDAPGHVDDFAIPNVGL